MTFLAIALLLFLVALVVLAIDLMIPTGGILIAVTVMLAAASIYFAFRHSPTSGWWVLTAALGMIPLMLFGLLYVWPRTPFGKILISAHTEFIPHGTVLIEDREFEAVSEAGPIDPGTDVRVTKLDVGRLVVIPYKSRSGASNPMSNDSSLDRPSDEIGLDSLS